MPILVLVTYHSANHVIIFNILLICSLNLTGSRKSLFNVFQDGNCHPKMALVIDDRLKVWDEKDQPRVHVVPAFAPYYAPQVEVCTIYAVQKFNFLIIACLFKI